MDLRLIRYAFEESGIYSVLRRTDTLTRIAITLEHAYPDTGSFFPKLPPGDYRCVRGLHTLKHSLAPFETFEVMDVPGHKGILFHVGNYNYDSFGCILVGFARQGNMIIESKAAFHDFMKLQDGVDIFNLMVE